MEQDLLTCSTGRFPGQTEILTRYSSPVFQVGKFRMEIHVPFTCFTCVVLVSGHLALSVVPVKHCMSNYPEILGE